jgi:hypothetical protein
VATGNNGNGSASVTPERLPDISFVAFIDVDAWNEAEWDGTVYVTDPKGVNAPALGIRFRNETPGRRIFANLIKRLGRQDEFDELRVSIVEGEIPEKPPGYSVCLGVDMTNIVRASKTRGVEIKETDALVTLCRINRMSPAPESPHLTKFKESYRRHNKCLVLPVFQNAGVLTPAYDLSIEKRQINFLRTDEITPADVEWAVMRRPTA